MMDYSEEYKSKLISAKGAAKLVKSGDWVDYGFAVNAPDALDKALASRVRELHDVHIRGGISLEMPAVCSVPGAKDTFTWNAWHCTGIDRKIINSGMGYFIPMRYTDLPRYYWDNDVHVNVAMIMVGPMDRHGYFSFALTTSHLNAVFNNADIVILEVNKNMPRAYGRSQSEIHISKVDYIVEGDNPPLRTQEPSVPTEADKKIADLVVREIPNGACLQLGIGSMPNAIGRIIADSDLKDLGVHSEMYVDAFVEMTEKGRISGVNKNIDRHKQIYSFAVGSQYMYDFLDENIEVLGAPVDYVNDPAIIASIDNFYSINNAIDMDIFGQINSESAGLKQISGTGGQLDFTMGAYASRGGKSFICLTSTFTNRFGSVRSRIRPTLASGSTVTTPRSGIQYIVTEYGMINLKGKSTWQRAEGIINLAHPDFREELISEAEKMGIWRQSNKR